MGFSRSRVRAGLIDVVNPRLARYTWAATIAFLTLCLQGAAISLLTKAQSCTKSASAKKTHPAIFGGTVAHAEFIADQLEQNGEVVSDDGRVTTRTTIDVCLAITADTMTYAAADVSYTALKEDGCHPPWVTCADGFPFDKTKPVTPQNAFCINDAAYVVEASSIGKYKVADLTKNLGLHSAGMHGGFPRIEWCSGEDNGRRHTALQSRHVSSYRYAWHTSHHCICGGDANVDQVLNSPWTCNEWASARHTCKAAPAEANPSGTPANKHICGYEVNGPQGYADTSQMAFRATYTVEESVETTTCPDLLTALGSAFGYTQQLEVVFTVLLLGLFASVGLAKPLSSTRGGVIDTAMGNSAHDNSAAIAALEQQVAELKAQGGGKSEATSRSRSAVMRGRGAG